MKLHFFRSVPAILLLILLASCTKQDFYSRYAHLPADGWSSDSVYVFSVHITDTMQPYDILWNIRNDGTYAYQNIWLFVSQQNPDGFIRKDTLEVMLMDNKGKWIGRGVSSLFQLEAPYISKQIFPDTGTYKFKVAQGMKELRLEGIKNIGLTITTHGQE